MFVCLDSLGPTPSQHFSAMSGWVFLGLTNIKQKKMCPTQGHNAVTPVRLEPTTPGSRVKRSSNEPVRFS